jgi:hypothetical protein
MSKPRFDEMHWNVSIGPEKWPIFGRFLTLFPLKRPARREKNTSNLAATIGDVTCKTSMHYQTPYSVSLFRQGAALYLTQDKCRV